MGVTIKLDTGEVVENTIKVKSKRHMMLASRLFYELQETNDIFKEIWLESGFLRKDDKLKYKYYIDRYNFHMLP